MAWAVAQNCSSIVAKRESIRHHQRTKQALHCVDTEKERSRQESHCVNTVNECIVQKSHLCEHHGRHSRRGITKNVQQTSRWRHLCGKTHFGSSYFGSRLGSRRHCWRVFVSCLVLLCICKPRQFMGRNRKWILEDNLSEAVMVLGTPNGSAPFVAEKLQSRVNDERRLWEAIPDIPDLQASNVAECQPQSQPHVAHSAACFVLGVQSIAR